ncbi:hypothetical protein J6590_012382 [Homalodisca vitripennis]|nr:hypothetical protein J6590_012382 [Homalodisca vitripennis]
MYVLIVPVNRIMVAYLIQWSAMTGSRTSVVYSKELRDVAIESRQFCPLVGSREEM